MSDPAAPYTDVATGASVFAPSAAINGVVRVWQGDITHLKIDAIQNAANTGLKSGGGICGAVHKAAGAELEAACFRYPELNTKASFSGAAAGGGAATAKTGTAAKNGAKHGASSAFGPTRCFEGDTRVTKGSVRCCFFCCCCCAPAPRLATVRAPSDQQPHPSALRRLDRTLTLTLIPHSAAAIIASSTKHLFFCLLIILLFAHLFFCLLIYSFVCTCTWIIASSTFLPPRRYNLHAKAVLHTVGPQGVDAKTLKSAYCSALDQVSVLLCTVTYYANRAHNLTRSP